MTDQPTLTYRIQTDEIYYETQLHLSINGVCVYDRETYYLIHDMYTPESTELFPDTNTPQKPTVEPLWFNFRQGRYAAFRIPSHILFVSEGDLIVAPIDEFSPLWDLLAIHGYPPDNMRPLDAFPPPPADLLFRCWLLSTGYLHTLRRLCGDHFQSWGLAQSFRTQILAEDPIDSPSVESILRKLEVGTWILDPQSIRKRPRNEPAVTVYLDGNMEWEAVLQQDRMWCLLNPTWMIQIQTPTRSRSEIEKWSAGLEDALFD